MANLKLLNFPNGDYRLLITQVNYHNTNKYFTIDNEHKNVDLGNITMNDKNKVLDEVVIEAPPGNIGWRYHSIQCRFF